MTLQISAKQKEVLDAFRGFAAAHGRTPSVRELAKLLGRAPSTIHQFLQALEDRGLLVNDEGAHGWRLAQDDLGETLTSSAGAAAGPARLPAQTEDAPRSLRVPILGTIAAGRPIEAIADPTDEVLLADGFAKDDAYALRVRGDSMIEDAILDGDVVVVQPQPRVENGEIAVALLEDGTATLKRLYRERDGRIRLQPANAALAPLYVDQVTVQGKVVGLLRRLG